MNFAPALIPRRASSIFKDTTKPCAMHIFNPITQSERVGRSSSNYKMNLASTKTRREYKRKWREKNPGYHTEASRRFRLNHPERVKLYVEKWRKNNKAAAKAYDLLHRAIRRGSISQQPCEVCGDTKSHAHHEDYSKPLDVNWLCRFHHMIEHINLRRTIESTLTK